MLYKQIKKRTGTFSNHLISVVYLNVALWKLWVGTIHRVQTYNLSIRVKNLTSLGGRTFIVASTAYIPVGYLHTCICAYSSVLGENLNVALDFFPLVTKETTLLQILCLIVFFLFISINYQIGNNNNVIS